MARSVAMRRVLFLLWVDVVGSCFVSLPGPRDEAPFSADEEEKLFQHFLRNLNINGTGAVIASPGDVPALVVCCNNRAPQPYYFHWTRDAALSLSSLISLGRNDSLPIMESFVARLRRQHARTVASGHLGVSAAEESFLEPKWTLSGAPYEGGWCRPQTDGPGLRALTLLRAATALPSLSKDLWDLASLDLEWLAKNPDMDTCDLWEETLDRDFLWNRAVTHAALVEGRAMALQQGDMTRAQRFAAAAVALPPTANHIAEAEGGTFLTNCPAENPGPACQRYDKALDGAIILSLVHAQAKKDTGAQLRGSTGRLPSPSSALAARSASQLAALFCRIYPVNRKDTEEGVPGVLFGRYEADRYGANHEGNPWILITAALANLLYKASAEASEQPMTEEAAAAWATFLGQPGPASPADLVAGGDAVLLRIRHHVGNDLRLHEQIDRHTGLQYNAKDLTWSYAEVLEALQSRRIAVAARRTP